MPRYLGPSIDAYNDRVTMEIDQLLAENRALKTRIILATIELEQLRTEIFTQPVRLQEVVNG